MLIDDAPSERPLLDSVLEPEPSSIREQRTPDSELSPLDLIDPRQLPAVRIELPRSKPAADIPGVTLPALANEGRVHVVRFDISLRTKPRVRIEWARFRAHFLPDDDANVPVVEDQHPLLVQRPRTHHVSLTINPSLKFQEIDASVGSYAHSYDYESLEPTISAAGRGGADLTWDYTAGTDATVTGSKRMFALLIVPAEMSSVHASLSVVADLRIDRFLLPASSSRADDMLTVEVIAAG